MRANFDFSGRFILVTGATGGLGSAIARGFAQAGASLFVHGTKPGPRMQALLASLAGGPGRHRPLYARIEAGGPRGSDESEEASRDAEELINELALELGALLHGRPLAALVNNAGIYPSAPLESITARKWREVLDANLLSAHLFTKALAPLLGRGSSIVNIASIEADRPGLGHAHYAAAKAGLVQYGKAAALELSGRGIRVNTISPGLVWREGLDRDWPEGYERYVSTSPLKRVVLPEELSLACLFLCSDAASAITGTNLVVDCGVSAVAAQSLD